MTSAITFVAAMTAAVLLVRGCSALRLCQSSYPPATIETSSMAEEDWFILDLHTQGWTDVPTTRDSKVPFHKVDPRFASAQTGTVQIAVTQGISHHQLWENHNLTGTKLIFTTL